MDDIITIFIRPIKTALLAWAIVHFLTSFRMIAKAKRMEAIWLKYRLRRKSGGEDNDTYDGWE